MKGIEFIYDAGCPNVEKTRAQLGRALDEHSLPREWREWERSDPAAPPYARKWPSPTILVAGRDIAGGEGIDGVAGCRVYVDERGSVQGVPSVEQIKAAVAKGTDPQTGWRRCAAVLPALGAAVVPGLTCPACWPAYAGLLSSLGVGFFNYTPYLFPLTLVCLVIALGSLGYRAQTRRGYGPLAIGTLGAVFMVLGKFAFPSNVLLAGGVGLLIAASIWNAAPRRKQAKEAKACMTVST